MIRNSICGTCINEHRSDSKSKGSYYIVIDSSDSYNKCKSNSSNGSNTNGNNNSKITSKHYCSYY